MARNVQIELGDVIPSAQQQIIKDLKKEDMAQTELTMSVLDVVNEFIERGIEFFWGEDGYNYDLGVGNEYNFPAGMYSFDAPLDEYDQITKWVYVGAGKIVVSNEKNADGSWVLKTILDGDGLSTEVVAALEIYASQIIGGNLKLTDNLKIVDQYGNDVLYIDSSGRVRLDASNILTESDLDDLEVSNAETANRISELQLEWETELEYIDGNLQTSISDIQAQYLADLDSWSDKINENELSLSTLSSRVVSVETDLGESSARWNAIDNSMIFANEGLFVGNVATNTGSWIRSSGSFDITLDGNTVGSFSDDGLTTEAIVTGTMQIGNYIHQSLSDGSMVIQWMS